MLPLPHLALALAAGGPAAFQIPWEADLDAALERAAAESKVVFVAINMDGETANDRMAKKTYHDRLLEPYLGACVAVAASKYDHGGASECPRFGVIPCAAHQKADIQVRTRLLGAGPDTSVVAPQHLWLDPEGKVLLSVPYVVSTDELIWCTVTAWQKYDAERAPRMPAGVRPPRRLVMDGVAPTGGGEIQPLSREELAALIRQAVAGGRGNPRGNLLVRMVATDDEDAIEFVTTQLRSGGGRRGGGGTELKIQVLEAVGRYSPGSWWVLPAEYASDAEPTVRSAAAAALEQLGEPRSLAVIKKQLGKEREAGLRRDWIRALAAAGAGNSGAQAVVLRTASRDKDPLVRANAVLALGFMEPSRKIQEFLLETLAAEDRRLARAAAVAMALSRETAYRPALEAAREAAGDEEEKALFERALEVLDGADHRRLAADFQELSQDDRPRPRLFPEG